MDERIKWAGIEAGDGAARDEQGRWSTEAFVFDRTGRLSSACC
jgi:hypothetical protein